MIVDDVKVRKFTLSQSFLGRFKGREPEWSGELGKFAYSHHYSRKVYDDQGREVGREEFWETLRRAVEGMVNIGKAHCFRHGLKWDGGYAQHIAQMAYELAFRFRWLPPGRGLWLMGTDFMYKHGSAGLNNCAFCSTQDADAFASQPFAWAMEALQLGVGVGYDVRGAGKLPVRKPSRAEGAVFTVPDTREGWVDSTRVLLDAFFRGEVLPKFDYSELRPEGSPLKSFGGTASGPGPLMELHEGLAESLTDLEGQNMRAENIVDVFGMASKCVMSGNIRRSAMIALGFPDDEEFLSLKERIDCDRKKCRWTANTSVFAVPGMDYAAIGARCAANGEPGIVWLDNVRKFGRLVDGPTHADRRVMGVNPCVTGDTLVAVADGRGAVSFSELAAAGDDVQVYCRDSEGKTVVRMMRQPRMTRESAAVVRVAFDDGSHVDCTPDHRFLTKDMREVKAEDLLVGESLAATKRWQTDWEEVAGREGKNIPYWMFHDGRRNKFEHTAVAEAFLGSVPPGHVVHHRDRDSLDNRRHNLDVLLKRDHDALHDISGEKNPMRLLKAKGRGAVDAYRASMSAAVSGTKNGRYSGYSDDDLLAAMKGAVDERGLPIGSRDWESKARELGMPFSLVPSFRRPLASLLSEANFEFLHHDYESLGALNKAVKDVKDLTSWGLKWAVVDDGSVRAVKCCETCGVEMLVRVGRRGSAYCSRACASANPARSGRILARANATKASRRDRVRASLLEIFERVVSASGRVPSAKSFCSEARSAGLCGYRSGGFRNYTELLDAVSQRYGVGMTAHSLRSGGARETAAAALKDSGLCYNHKVVSVKPLGEQAVYNGTVDEFHNYGIVVTLGTTGAGRPREEMVFSLNCGEQALEPFELCNLVETFPARHATFQEYLDTLTVAHFYGKMVTLLETHWPQTNLIMRRNMRMGISQSGIVQALVRHGHETMRRWCDDGYAHLRARDRELSAAYGVPESVKLTSVKPSGTVSLLPGATPGIHYAHSRYYIRRYRIEAGHPLARAAAAAGYPVERDVNDPKQEVVEFVVDEGESVGRTKSQVGMWEQLCNAAQWQKYWADNQVSVTVTCGPDELREIPKALVHFEDQLKCVTFLPRDDGAGKPYPQMPYEAISGEEYARRAAAVSPIHYDGNGGAEAGERFCDGDRCNL